MLKMILKPPARHMILCPSPLIQVRQGNMPVATKLGERVKEKSDIV